jgi:hypothetical protein
VTTPAAPDAPAPQPAMSEPCPDLNHEAAAPTGTCPTCQAREARPSPWPLS